MVNHVRMAPTRVPEILERVTAMRVQLITEGMAVERNHVYVIPSNCELTLRGDRFRLKEISKPFGWPRVLNLSL
jgi:chemotaxis response regulator CheB